MGKTAKNIFDEKVNLIYEFNKKSPLFVRKANAEIFANNTEAAVDILTEGLQNYPNYPSALIVLGKAYTILGKYDEALSAYQKGCNLINSEESLKYFTEEVADHKKQASPFEQRTRHTFTVEENTHHVESKTDFDFGFSESPAGEDDLKELAEKISSAKFQPPKEIEPKREEEPQTHEEVAIASETLAKIYEAQGEFKEAIDMYHRLIKKTPPKKNYFLERIAELQNKYSLE